MSKNISYLLSGIGLMCLMSSCDSDLWKVEDDSKGTFTPEECSPISTTLDQSGEYEEWVKVLNYSETYAVLNAIYDGVNKEHAYTALAPTDEALQSFYRSKGVSSIEELGKDYAKALVKTMTLDGDSLKLTEKFTSDVAYYLPDSAMKSVANQYFVFLVDEARGGFDVTSLTTAAESDIIHTKAEDYIHLSRHYIKCTNGFVYKADGVLTPLVENVYDRIKNSGKSNIMISAFEATGYDKKLLVEADTTVSFGKRKIEPRQFTVLNVTDEVFAAAGINTLSDLKAAIVNHASNASADPDQLLRQYVEYHLIDGAFDKYSIVKMDGGDTVRIWETLAKSQIMMISRTLDRIDSISTVYSDKLIADTIYHCYFNTDDLADQMLDVANSNIKATNGVVHNLTSWMPVYEPKPTKVIWDLAAYREVRNAAGGNYQPSVPDKVEYKMSLANLACYDVEMGPNGTNNASYPSLCYVTCKSNLKGCLNNDRVVINVGAQGSVKMKTPTVVKGKYKVNITLAMPIELGFIRTQNGCKGGLMRVYVDGQVLSHTVEEQKLTIAPYTSIPKSTSGIYEVPLYEEIEFTETRSHEFRFVVLDPAASTNSKFCLQFDAITFYPIED